VFDYIPLPGNLNFLEPSGPLQACNGTALPLPLPFTEHIGYIIFWELLCAVPQNKAVAIMVTCNVQDQSNTCTCITANTNAHTGTVSGTLLEEMCNISVLV